MRVPAEAMKLAEVEPAGITTEVGVVRDALLVLSATGEPPLGARVPIVTVHVLLAPEFSDEGLQLRPVSCVGTTRFTECVSELPLSDAVTAAVELLVKVPAVAVKLAEVAPDGTVTAVGVVSELLLLLNETAVPPLGAAALMVTVHVLLPFEFSDVGLQVRFDSTVGATRFREKVRELPFRFAVTTAVELVASVPAVAVKFAVVAPAGTVTAEGAVSDVLLLLSETAVPPLGAAALMVTVHVLLPF
ncbi:MAG: hypothetical protein KJZ84_06995, partial [Bryobacteraceae bacterium]|nr:hypothetical protein [Bryobacteraceae bacterium]